MKALRHKIQTAPALQGLPITRYTLVGLVLLVGALLSVLQFVLESMAKSEPEEFPSTPTIGQEDMYPMDSALNPDFPQSWKQ